VGDKLERLSNEAAVAQSEILARHFPEVTGKCHEMAGQKSWPAVRSFHHSTATFG
jgi:hypothetical protein